MIYSFLYVIISSVGTVFIEKLYSSISPFFSLLITATIATLFFNIINIGKLKKFYSACYQQKFPTLFIMITVFGMWMCAMISPGLVGASLYAFLYFTWLGTLGFIFSAILNWKIERSKLYFGLCALILICAVIWSTLERTCSYNVILGMLLALIGGTSNFIYLRQSQKLIRKIQLTATQILAVRFYLTIFILFIVLPKDSFPLYFTGINLLELTFLSVITLIAPLFFMQKALEKITSEQNAIIMSLSPVATAILQEAIFHNVEFKFILVYSLYSVIITGSYFLNKYKVVKFAV